MQIKEFVEAHRADLGKREARYERKFAEEVLAHIPDLDLRDVATQTRFRDFEGKRRAIDFTISEGAHVRVAIEVDGWDKTGSKRGMTPPEFHDWSAREIAMVANGWTVLRFANSLLNHYPEQCVRAIELTLEAEREVARRLDLSGVERDAVAGEVDELETELQKTSAELSAAQQELDAVRSEKLSERMGKLAAERGSAAATVLSAADQDELERLGEARAVALRELERELADTIAARDEKVEENRRMKTVAIAFAVALVAVAVIVLAISGGGDSGDGGSAQVTATSSAAAGEEAGGGGNDSGSGASQPVATVPAKCEDAISWQKARNEIGSQATVRGPVVGAVFAETTNASPTYLNLGKDFPAKDRFTIVIFGDDRKNFRGAPEDAYEGKEIAVEGEISEFNGVAQMIANHRNDIAVC